MPDQISVSEFIAETTEDYNSPTTSSFTTRLHNCRNTVTLLEECQAVCLAFPHHCDPFLTREVHGIWPPRAERRSRVAKVISKGLGDEPGMHFCAARLSCR